MPESEGTARRPQTTVLGAVELATLLPFQPRFPHLCWGGAPLLPHIRGHICNPCTCVEGGSLGGPSVGRRHQAPIPTWRGFLEVFVGDVQDRQGPHR